jgi:hypothetical protein
MQEYYQKWKREPLNPETIKINNHARANPEDSVNINTTNSFPPKVSHTLVER